MDLDTRYAITRDRAYSLGFEQPLPIGSLAIVTALLDELVQTSGNLKHAQAANKQLQEVSRRCIDILEFSHSLIIFRSSYTNIFLFVSRIIAKGCLGTWYRTVQMR